MKKIPGVPPAELAELNRAQDRVSFVYLERCVIHRDSNAITATDEKGVVHLPAATLGVLMLGPGTSITQQAMMLIADNGATVVWVKDGLAGLKFAEPIEPEEARAKTMIAPSRAAKPPLESPAIAPRAGWIGDLRDAYRK